MIVQEAPRAEELTPEELERIQKEQIHQTAILCNDVKIEKGAKIMSGCVIGSNVKIGENTVIFPNKIT